MNAYNQCVKVDRDGVLRPPKRALSYPLLTKALQEYLGWMTVRRRNQWSAPPVRYTSTEELVLFNCPPVWSNLYDTIIPPMDAAECFDNCWRVSQANPALRYTEGYALMCGSIPTHHAWLVDDAGRVEDPTWPALYRAHAEAAPERNWSGRAVYMGVSIDQAAHRRWVIRRSLMPMLLAVHEDDIEEVLRLGPAAFEIERGEQAF